MPARKPYRKADKWANEKELARGIGSGLNDVIGRGTLAGLLGAPGDIAGAFENAYRSLTGKPQVQPWGGSEHIGSKMEKAGWVSPERRPKTELLASLISPAQLATATLRSPKYAANMLKALDNLDAVPTMRNLSQRGAIDVWHGSPHKFEQFKAMDNVGAGEGAQAYGHGGYHASTPEVAKQYSDNLTDFNTDGPVIRDYSSMVTTDVGNSVSAVVDGHKRLIEKTKQQIAALGDNPDPIALKVRLGIIKRSENIIAEAQNKGNLYRNQLRWPDPAREATDPLSDKHFLDWDKPLSEQPQFVQAAFADFPQDMQGSAAYQSLKYGQRPVGFNDAGEPMFDGMAALRHVQSGGGNSASEFLKQQGIPGIRYLDGGSRSAGAGTHNYVTFDDALVNILERNGQPVTAPQPGLLGKMVAPQDEALRVAQQKKFKTDEGNFSVYDVEKNPTGRGDMFTVHQSKDGYVVRNALVPEAMQRKGLATSLYQQVNAESLAKTGKPLRSTQPRTLSSGETVHELSPDAVALWDSFVKKGLAEKVSEKNYRFLSTPQRTQF